jgi:Tfp pilus assembly protein PilF
MVIFRKLCRTLTIVMIALAVGACGRNDPATLIASARGYLEKNDYKAAIIQLKTALQSAPDNAEARFLLGKSLLEGGDPASAETEIRKALDLKYSADEAYPLLARALLQQGQYQKVVTELANRKFLTPGAQAVHVSASIKSRRLAPRLRPRLSRNPAMSTRRSPWPSLPRRKRICRVRRSSSTPPSRPPRTISKRCP